MIKIILILFILNFISFAEERYVLQIASFLDTKELENAKKQFKGYELMTRKSGKYTTLNALNLSEKDIQKIKKSYPDAIVRFTYEEKVEKKQEQKEETKKELPESSQEEPTNKNTSKTTKQDNKSLEVNSFQKARYLYSQKQYQAALAMFENLQNTPVDPKHNDFYIGRSHYELKNYEQAMSAFERILINDPEHLRAKLELAQTYLKLNLLKDAKKEYLSVLHSENVPDVVKSNISKQLELIESKTLKHFISVTGILGIGYDSNINNGTDILEYSVYIPQFLSNAVIKSPRQEGAVTFETGAVLNHIYKINDKTFIRNSATLYMQRYQNRKNRDLQVFSVSTTPTYVDNKNIYSFSVSYDHVWYGHVNFLNNYAFTPKYSRSISQVMLYDISLKFARKDFYKPYQYKDSNLYELSNKLSYIDKTYGLFASEIILGKENKLGGIRTDVSRDSHALKLLHTHKFSNTLLLNSNIDYENIKYKLKDVNFLNRRNDKKMLYGLSLMNISSKNITLNLNFQYIENSSNQVAFDYDKYLIKSFLYYNF